MNHHGRTTRSSCERCSNGAEETPPEGLEARILEALDAQTIQPNATNRAPWIAAAVAGSIVVASIWMSSGEELQPPTATVPVGVSAEQVVEPVRQPSLKQTSEVAPSKKAVEQQPSEGANEASQAVVRTEEESLIAQKLEVPDWAWVLRDPGKPGSQSHSDSIVPDSKRHRPSDRDVVKLKQ